MSDGAITPEELAQLAGATMGNQMSGLFPAVDPAAPVAPAQPAPQPAFTPPPPAAEPAPVTAKSIQFAPLEPRAPGNAAGANLDLLLNVNLKVTVELGRTQMTIKEILRLAPGSVVELDKLAGEPVDVLVNDRPIARGEVVVIDDRFGVRITDVLSPAQRINSLK